jgi:nicotinate-nucleotide adenylyltransferase
VKLGVFGGGFDPIHDAHLFVAEVAREECGLDRVIFVPTLHGRHREPPQASADDRARMIRLAIAPNPRFALDLSDLAPEATGFTIDLLPRLHARFPDDELSFIAGGDSLVRSPWHRLADVLEMLERFIIAPRGEVTQSELDAALADVPKALRHKVILIDIPRVTESATLVRARLGEGKSVRYLVPEPVYRYIEEHRLYRSPLVTQA